MGAARTKSRKKRDKKREPYNPGNTRAAIPQRGRPKAEDARVVAIAARERLGIPAADALSQLAGCSAGRAIMQAALDGQDRGDLWQAAQHMRRVRAAYLSAIGAPNPHPQCLRILAPTEATETAPDDAPADTRTDQERTEAAIRAHDTLQSWLLKAGPVAANAARVVYDDATCRNPAQFRAVLLFIVAGIKGNYSTPKAEPII
ncbi:MAG: hypothetical protein EBR82_76540 [Caulobacteraceae bacterium]|nr:hypothetical protein [Caulobacteraceae bacterium]